MTRDIDIVVALGPADTDKVVSLFEPDYYLPHDAVRRAVRERGMFNLLHLDSAVRVDLVVRKDEPYRQQEFQRRAQIELPGFSIWIVSKEDLVLSKLASAKDSHSELQMRHVRNLLATGADIGYLHQWAPGLEVTELLEKCLHERHEP